MCNVYPLVFQQSSLEVAHQKKTELQAPHQTYMMDYTIAYESSLTSALSASDGSVPGAVQAYHCDPDVGKCHKADRSSAQVQKHILFIYYIICSHGNTHVHMDL